MSNYNINLTPQLINLATEGSLDSSIINGKSYQRTFNMYEVTDGNNRKMINSVSDGDTFNDSVFQNSMGTGPLTPTVPISFDPLKLGDGIVLSNNNLTAAISNISNIGGETSAVTNVAIKNGEKANFSMIIDLWSLDPERIGVGICGNVFDVNDFLGDLGANSIGLYDDGYYFNSSIDSYLLGITFTIGSLVETAVDRLNNLIWFRVDQGPWNGNINQDPFTTSGGIDISFISGDVYPAVSLYSNNSISGQITVSPELTYF